MVTVNTKYIQVAGKWSSPETAALPTV